jgi:hypothetical protein
VFRETYWRYGLLNMCLNTGARLEDAFATHERNLCSTLAMLASLQRPPPLPSLHRSKAHAFACDYQAPPLLSLLPPSTPPFPVGPTLQLPNPRRHERHPSFLPVFTQEPEKTVEASGTSSSIHCLRAALQLVDAKIANLTRERHQLASSLDRAVRVSSPIQRLPRELLSAIFTAGVCEDGDGQDDPLVLGAIMLVCSRWREIAVDTPALWSRITVDEHNSVEAARRRVARSKDTPLDVRLSFAESSEHGPGMSDVMMRALDMLRPTVIRWRSFA